jgi:hypothetical protein
MRNTLRVLLILGTIVVLLGATGCSALNANDPYEVQIRIVGVTPVGGVAYLQAGEDYDIEAETFNQDGHRLSQYQEYEDYEWGSTDTDVAFMRGNVQTVRASHPGNCTISAALKGEGIVGTVEVQVE